jgi:hypothetical protein
MYFVRSKHDRDRRGGVGVGVATAVAPVGSWALDPVGNINLNHLGAPSARPTLNRHDSNNLYQWE